LQHQLLQFGSHVLPQLCVQKNRSRRMVNVATPFALLRGDDELLHCFCRRQQSRKLFDRFIVIFWNNLIQPPGPMVCAVRLPKN
ncbi:hypothetical protein, partial [Paraburkholderia sp. UYCP14C]|uniref:hypothetical protein n=1 Tax=Paraburkholderia sp. UYCP14C TaxID=2511130 RepID=UPI001B7D5E86